MQQQAINASASRSERESYWLPLVKQWQESKESSKSFCQRLTLNLDQFNYWRRKILNTSVDTHKFIKLEVEPTRITNKNSIQIELPSGIKITLLGNLDRTQVNQVFSLLGMVHG